MARGERIASATPTPCSDEVSQDNNLRSVEERRRGEWFSGGHVVDIDMAAATDRGELLLRSKGLEVCVCCVFEFGCGEASATSESFIVLLWTVTTRNRRLVESERLGDAGSCVAE